MALTITERAALATWAASARPTRTPSSRPRRSSRSPTAWAGPRRERSPRRSPSRRSSGWTGSPATPRAAARHRPVGQPADLRPGPGRGVAARDGHHAHRRAGRARRREPRPRRRQPRLPAARRRARAAHPRPLAGGRAGAHRPDRARRRPSTTRSGRSSPARWAPSATSTSTPTRSPAAPGDVFLLCSDGLTSMISNDEIASILRAAARWRRQRTRWCARRTRAAARTTSPSCCSASAGDEDPAGGRRTIAGDGDRCRQRADGGRRAGRRRRAGAGRPAAPASPRRPPRHHRRGAGRRRRAVTAAPAPLVAAGDASDRRGDPRRPTSAAGRSTSWAPTTPAW